ncbi:MAG: D-alanyl-D-alanine carboxypeptidase/D-alanyl-D-alanine-endopeptidase [Muribaculaceae bacterium]
MKKRLHSYVYSVVKSVTALGLLFAGFQQGAAQLAVDSTMPEDLSLQEPAEDTVMNIPARVGLVIRNLSTGRNVVERNPEMFFTPASVMKTVTSAAAVINGHIDRRYATEAFTEGAISGGKLYGNLVVVASGDPTTDSKRFIGNHGIVDSIAAHMRKLGVDTIRGQIVFETGAVPDDGPSVNWPRADLKYDYGAGHYAINYKDNTIEGTDKAIADPVGAFYDALEEALASRGVAVLDEKIHIRAKRHKIYRQESPTFREILHDMMVRSDNLFAEAMLRRLAPGKSPAMALHQERRLISKIGIDTTRIKIFDGSGLSRKNSVTPNAIADVLENMAQSKWSKSYTDLFPRAGVNGTVRRLLAETPLAGKIALKSGSMRGVQCWAGYKFNSKGRPTHAIVFLINDFSCPRDSVVKAAEKVMLDNFDYYN